MSKTLSAKYYQENKERLQKKLVKHINIFLKKKKKKGNNMVLSASKIYQKLFEYRKNHYRIKKNLLL